jgi:hypothetical protein
MKTQVIIAAAALACFATVESFATDLKKMVPSGTHIEVDHFTSLHEDCTPSGEIIIRVKSQPNHGSVTIKKGQIYPSYPSDNPRNVCNSKKAVGMTVDYVSEPDYVGSDSFSLLVLFPSGNGSEVNYSIDVK